MPYFQGVCLLVLTKKMMGYRQRRQSIWYRSSYLTLHVKALIGRSFVMCCLWMRKLQCWRGLLKKSRQQPATEWIKMWHSNTAGIVQWKKCTLLWEQRTPGSANFWANHLGGSCLILLSASNEMCLMSNCHGDLRVFAASGKKKQEKLLQDCHCSITVMRTGIVADTTGPTMFL